MNCPSSRLPPAAPDGPDRDLPHDVLRLPPAPAGLRVGLLGGSFNPAHAAHRALSLLALKRLGLDQVWWLVTPGNPLKDNRALPTLAERVRAAQRVAHHPRIKVTGAEAGFGTRYTYDTLLRVRTLRPGARFVWLMGADNLATFHLWQHWRDIADLVPIAVVDRMGTSFAATASRAGQALCRSRIAESDAALLPGLRPPAWVFLHGLKSPLSSTAIRHQLRRSAAAQRGEDGVES